PLNFRELCFTNLGNMSGVPHQRCPDLEKFDEHLGEIEGAACRSLSRAEIIGNLTNSM
ncbi:hypothetical protein HAX54_043000, partial [Datura stramonium]|nr:hypothetical protein [Datura stramonium]